jgi:hypothetical protein
MKKAWKKIAADERVNISINLRQIGICIIGSSIEDRKYVSIPMV